MAGFNVNDFGGITVQLDRPREIKLTHKALKKFGQLTGCKLDNMEDAIQDPAKLEALYYAMLQQDAADNGETLKAGKMEDILDFATPGTLIAAAGKAIELAFGDAVPDEDTAAAPTTAAGATATA